MRFDIKTIALVGVLAAFASVLMFFPHFPIFPPPANFLDVDFSDVPALFASVVINPFAGIIVVLIKNLLHLCFTQTFGVGELSNLILGTVFSLSAGLLSRYTFRRTVLKKKLLFVLPVCVVIVATVAMLSNYFLVLPTYAHIMGWSENIEMLKFVTVWILPFNLIKATFQVIVFYLLYRGIYPHIQKRLYY